MSCIPPGRLPISCGCFATGSRRQSARTSRTISTDDQGPRGSFARGFRPQAGALKLLANHFPELFDPGFVAPVERPLFDSLAADQTGLRQNLEVLARGRLAHAEL